MITLSIDAMGGDAGLSATVPAALSALKQHSDLSLILCGDQSAIESELDKRGRASSARLQIQHCSQVVEMTDAPAYAMKNKKDSSMRVAINLIKENRSHGCISSGNTGALMATARFVLKTIRGIERPAICSNMPRTSGHTYMLDLGANVDSPPAHLFQFGVMGSILASCLDGKPKPTVGLLNIGVEDIKGNDTIKATAGLFKDSELNYVGYVEANQIYTGNTDVIVCDGLIGNIALKASEGAAAMILGTVKQEFTRNLTSKCAGLMAKPVLNAIRHRLDHRHYNGASFLGLRGTVVKSHGSSDDVGFVHAINVAMEEVKQNLVSLIEETIIENGAS